MKQHGGQKIRKQIVFINTGTYCDGSLMDCALNQLTKNYRVTYVCDEGLARSTAVGQLMKEIITYQTPDFIIRDINIASADTQQNIITWALLNPVKALKTQSWIKHVAALIDVTVLRVKPCAVVFHYGLMATMWITKRDLTTIPHFAIYFAPGVPNRVIPWVFDGNLRDHDFKLYSRASQQVAKSSWSEYVKRLSFGNNDPEGVLASIHHVLCWDRELTKAIPPLISGLHLHQVGSFITRQKVSWDAPQLVRQFIKQSSPVVFISFGSFGGVEKVAKVTPIIVTELLKYDVVVLVHDTSKAGLQLQIAEDNPLRVHIHHGFIPYDWIVPRVDKVMFTGSVCLQQTCFDHKIPMIFVPLLTEQFFWSKNYQYFTGTPYLELDQPKEIPTAIERAFKSHTSERSKNFVETVYKSMRKHNGCRNFLKLVGDGAPLPPIAPLPLIAPLR